ncbi:hypothetical protein [Desulfosporosinus sp. FKB]|uniref:hypothetical protein n=1 Tax=Desulfosporosinus sp. FKB TaxID=1969835 RepID=UPI000B498BF9|nr:hypothetical protein [Desulfosporosinus sp. FKB]
MKKTRLKKVMKLVSSVIVSALLLNVALVIPASAQSIPVNTNNKEVLVGQTVINEYDKYKELINTNDDTLLSEGYSKEEVNKLRSVDYKGLLKARVEKNAKLSDNDLIKKGYTSNQISQIRNYKGTEDQMQALSASLYLSTYNTYHINSPSKSEADFRTDWTWTSPPIFERDDLWAATWSEGMYLMDSVSFATAQYYLQTDDTYHHSEYLGSLTPNLNNGASKKIYLISSSYPGTYAKTGSVYYDISKQAQVPELAVLAKYGHTQIAINPTVAFSTSGALGITFSYGVAEMGTNNVHITTM